MYIVPRYQTGCSTQQYAKKSTATRYKKTYCSKFARIMLSPNFADSAKSLSITLEVPEQADSRTLVTYSLVFGTTFGAVDTRIQ